VTHPTIATPRCRRAATTDRPPARKPGLPLAQCSSDRLRGSQRHTRRGSWRGRTRPPSARCPCPGRIGAEGCHGRVRRQRTGSLPQSPGTGIDIDLDRRSGRGTAPCAEGAKSRDFLGFGLFPSPGLTDLDLTFRLPPYQDPRSDRGRCLCLWGLGYSRIRVLSEKVGRTQYYWVLSETRWSVRTQ
jgi:hypothetical protein